MTFFFLVFQVMLCVSIVRPLSMNADLDLFPFRLSLFSCSNLFFFFP
jgi:hypothetical protein